jgi:hypothetical protein
VPAPAIDRPVAALDARAAHAADTAPETIAFCLLIASASVMATGYAVDLLGVAMHPAALALPGALPLVGSACGRKFVVRVESLRVNCDSDVSVLETFGSFAVVRNSRAIPCP